TLAHGCVQTSATQVLFGVAPDRLEESVAHPAGVFADLDQRGGDQLCKRVEQELRIIEDGLERVDSCAANEHGQPLQQRLGGWVEKAVAPVEGGAQRTVAVELVIAAAEDAERISQATGDLFDGQDFHARGGQLDGQWDTVESAAHVADRGGG